MPRGARPPPARRHPGAARVDGRAPAPRSSRPTPSRPRRLKLEEWGLGEHTLRDQPEGRRDRAQGRRRGPLRRRLDRPDRPPARLRRPDARRDHLRRARRDLHPAGPGPGPGGADLIIIETAQDILEVKAADLRRARGVQAREPASLPIQTSVSLLPNGGKMLLGTDISAVLADARGAEGRRHRAELLHRPRGHARRDPLPRRVLRDAHPLHPERRPAAAGAATARRSSPRAPTQLADRPGRVRRAATASRSSAAAAARPPTTSPRSPSA